MQAEKTRRGGNIGNKNIQDFSKMKYIAPGDMATPLCSILSSAVFPLCFSGLLRLPSPPGWRLEQERSFMAC